MCVLFVWVFFGGGGRVEGGDIKKMDTVTKTCYNPGSCNHVTRGERDDNLIINVSWPCLNQHLQLQL